MMAFRMGSCSLRKFRESSAACCGRMPVVNLRASCVSGEGNAQPGINCQSQPGIVESDGSSTLLVYTRWFVQAPSVGYRSGLSHIKARLLQTPCRCEIWRSDAVRTMGAFHLCMDESDTATAALQVRDRRACISRDSQEVFFKKPFLLQRCAPSATLSFSFTSCFGRPGIAVDETYREICFISNIS
jgi:hypothetical protein